MNEKINPFTRFLLAFFAFFAVLFDRRFAGVAFQYREVRALPPTPGEGAAKLPATAPPARAARPEADRRDALHLLAILQRDGRLVDFIQEDVGPFSDAEVGAAARTVHEGCRKAIQGYFALEPIYREPEGANIVVPDGFDAASVRLTGNVVGKPPFRGMLKHPGWRVTEVRLPSTPEGQDPAVLAPAEVELP